MNNRALNLFSIHLINLRRLVAILAVCFCLSCSICLAQTAAVSPSPVPTPISTGTARSSSPERAFLKNILKDQGAIWTSPFRLKKRDMSWLIPLTAGTAVLIATDRKTAGELSNDRTRINTSLDISRFGSAYTTGGTALAFYAIGKITGNQKAQETGLLAGEALINSRIVVEALKLISQRPRPLYRNGHGNFYTGGNSFPSGHSASAWTLAAVVSDEYGKQHPFIKYGAYGLATAVSLSRYTARKHFLSDILVGGAIGYGIGHFTYLRHHDSALDSGSGVKKTTKLEKYFPLIAPQYDKRGKVYGASLAWNL